MDRNVTASGITLLGAFLLTRDHLWATTELGLLYILVGAVTLGLWFVRPERRLTARIAGGVVGAWVALATTLRVSALLDDRPYLSVTDPTLWEVIYLDTELLAAFVAALMLPFAVGHRRVRRTVGAVLACLYVATLAQYGSGGFGLRFDLLFTTALFAAGVLSGLVAAVPAICADSDR
jgi:hypothetical protein